MTSKNICSLRSAFFIILLLTIMAIPLQIQAQFGRITGRVVEAETGDELPGANVYLEGTLLGDATDADGQYSIDRVPIRTYSLNVDYLGYETQMASVTVEAGMTTKQDFFLRVEAIAGAEVVVLGARAKNQAAALNQQMNAPNIKNIVAADMMGRFPDASAPESVQRLPGISVQRDQGEGRYIQIRGGSPSMTSVTYNGERVPSPEGSLRQIALDMVPSEILESIEVSKAITPDMEPDAIGGGVNLVTKRAPYKRVFSIELAPGYSSIRNRFAGKGSITFGDRTADGKLGYLLSGTSTRRSFGSDDLEPEYKYNKFGEGVDALDELHVRYYSLMRERMGFVGVFDYQLNDNTSLYLNSIFNQLTDEEERNRLRLRPGKAKNYAAPDSAFNGRIQYEHKSRKEVLSTRSVKVGGDHLFTGGSKLDIYFNYAQSTEDTPRDVEIEWRQKKVDFFPDISDPDNIRANPEAGALDPSKFKFDNLEPALSLTTNRDIVAAANYSIPYQFGQSTGNLQVGFKFRKKEKKQDVTENEYELKDDADDIYLGVGNGVSYDDYFGKDYKYNPGDYDFLPIVTSDDEVNNFLNDHKASLEGGHVYEDDSDDFDATEQTIAFYGMTTINLTPQFMILGGARFERTNLENTGYLWDPDDEETLTPIKGSSDYSHVLPMVHARYRLTPRTNIRAAFTTAIGRPNFFDVTPYSKRDDEDFKIGNPTLKTVTSQNYDLMLETYNQRVGVFSAGLFYKVINDPIYIFTRDTSSVHGDGVVDQPRNGKSGWVRGFEISIQQQLSFLPPPFDGLGIYANFTGSKSEATLPDGRVTKLTGQADQVWNLALSYEKAGFSGQLSVNNHGEFIDELGGDVSGAGASEKRWTDVFIDDHLQVDFSGSYRVTPGITVFLELVNLTNEPFELYRPVKDRPIQAEYYESWGWIGIKYKL